ncbi:MAG TPA: phage tail protein [Polyangium sp.]|nr:phage tail protein [Polyangium sp.]
MPADSRPYPLAAYNFRVQVGPNTINFTEVTGIELAYQHVVYRHGLSFWEGEQIDTFHFDEFAPITMKRGMILNSSPTFLYEWLRKKELRTLEVQLCNPDGNAVMAWKIAHAIPVKLSAPTFAANTNDVVIDVLEVQARGVSLVKL